MTLLNNDNSIFYKFEEKDNYENKIINVDEFMSDMEKSYSSTSTRTSTRTSSRTHSDNDNDNDNDSDVDQNFLEVEYSTCYNVKSLSQIMDYYELSKKNMRKDEMIQLIILFEIDPINLPIVNRRRRMWRHINELKRDKYFNKFILFTMV
jgi:hypothetical protein